MDTVGHLKIYYRSPLHFSMSMHTHVYLNIRKYSNYLTVLKLMAVACAAIFVPFRAFLKPSIPHDLNNFTSPAKENYSLQ